MYNRAGDARARKCGGASAVTAAEIAPLRRAARTLTEGLGAHDLRLFSRVSHRAAAGARRVRRRALRPAGRPLERHNLLDGDARPAPFEELRTALLAWMRDGDDPLLGARGPLVAPQHRRALHLLGA